MAAQLSFIPKDGITISNGGTGASPATYDLNLTSSLESAVNITPLVSEVDNKQSIMNGNDIEMSFVTFDDDILSDARVQTSGSSVPANTAKVVFNGAVGSADITIDNIRLHVSNPFVFENGRIGQEIKGTGRYLGSPIAISTAS